MSKNFSAKNELFLAKMLVYEQGRSEREENAARTEERRLADKVLEDERMRILRIEAARRIREEEDTAYQKRKEDLRKEKIELEERRKAEKEQEEKERIKRDKERAEREERWRVQREERDKKFTRVYKPRAIDTHQVYMLYRDENMMCPYYEQDEAYVPYEHIDAMWIRASYQRLVDKGDYLPYIRFVAWFYTAEEREEFVKGKGRHHFGCYD